MALTSSALAAANGPPAMARVDHLLIADMVARGSRVLDIGCGDGALLELLQTRRDVDGRGIEISQDGVNLCVARGLSVVQGDADSDLQHYPDRAFDYAILSQTLQATRKPKEVLQQLLRIGNHVIVSFPNFGHWWIRLQLLLYGRMPKSETLAQTWYDTPNIHLCTMKDFVELCEQLDVCIERSLAVNARGRRLGIAMPLSLQNLVGEQALFLLTKNGGPDARS